MKLKTRVTSLDEVPEQYKDKYVAAPDGTGFTLEEIEFEEPAEAKKHHERLFKQLKTAQEELKAVKDKYGDLDPEAAREAQKKIEELENKTLMDEGKFEELFNKRTEAERRDHKNQLDALLKNMEAEKIRASTLEKELQRTVIANDLSMQAAALHIEPELIPFLQLAAKEAWVLDDEGKPVWKVDGQLKYGKDSTKPATMTDYLSEMIATTPALVKGSSGNGANGNTSRGGAGLTISKSDMRDVRKYEAVKAQAAKQGLSMTEIQVTE